MDEAERVRKNEREREREYVINSAAKLI